MRAGLPVSDTVTAAIYDAGFNSNGRFYANASEVLGMAPTDFREGGAGQDIRFAIPECSLGLVLIRRERKRRLRDLFGDRSWSSCGRDLQNQFRERG